MQVLGFLSDAIMTGILQTAFDTPLTGPFVSYTGGQPILDRSPLACGNVSDTHRRSSALADKRSKPAWLSSDGVVTDPLRLMHFLSVHCRSVAGLLPSRWGPLAPPYRQSPDLHCLPGTAIATAKLHCCQLPGSYYNQGLRTALEGTQAPYPLKYRYRTTHVPNCNYPLTPTTAESREAQEGPRRGKDHNG